jgi:L-cystine uptake protein TcyP (sodium:dicarboxylate symporter family)
MVLITSVYPMKAILQNIKKHPTSIIFYVIYAFLWRIALIPAKKDEPDGGLLGLAGFFTAIVFIIISLVKAIHTKDQYYVWLILFIVAPVVIGFIMYG